MAGVLKDSFSTPVVVKGSFLTPVVVKDSFLTFSVAKNSFLTARCDEGALHHNGVWPAHRVTPSRAERDHR